MLSPAGFGLSYSDDEKGQTLSAWVKETEMHYELF